MKRRLWLALALVSWPWSVAVGQDFTAAENQREAAIRALHAGQRIAVSAARGGQLQGNFASLAEGELLLTRDSALTRVAVADIDRLWVRGRATKTGAVVGALTGTVLGVGLGVFIGEVICDGPDCHGNTAQAVIVLGLGGGAVGGLAGTLIGLAIPRWNQRFP